MNQSRLLVLIIIFFFIDGCKVKESTNKNVVTEALKQVELVDDYVFPMGKNSYIISKANLEANLLSIIVEYSGGCKLHNWSLKGSKSFMKSFPPKKGLFLEHDSQGDICRTLITDTLIFDVSAVKYPDKEKNYNVILMLSGYKENLVYSY